MDFLVARVWAAYAIAPEPPLGCADLTSPMCVAESVTNGMVPGAGTLTRKVVEGGGQALENLAGTAAKGAVQYGVDGLAQAIQYAVSWVVTNTVSWWTRIDSPCLVADSLVGCSGPSAVNAIERIQRWTLPFAVAVAALSLLAAAAKIAVTRRTTPLLDTGTGMLVILGTGSLGVLLPALLLKAGDEWSSWVLNLSAGDLSKKLVAVLGLAGASPGVVIVLGIAGVVIAAVQAVLLLFRQAALVVLAGVLPLAAAGSMTPLTRPWFRRVAGWMLALIFYKPAAAMVYATAFTMFGNASDARATFMGFAMVFLSILAMPALLKFFTWASGSVSEAASGGGLLGTAVGGAVAVGAFRGVRGGSGGIGAGGASAVDHARFMSSAMPPPKGARPAAAPGRSPSAGRTAGASTASAAAAARAGAAAGPAAGAAGAVITGLATGAKKAGDTVSSSMDPPRQESA